MKISVHDQTAGQKKLVFLIEVQMLLHLLANISDLSSLDANKPFCDLLSLKGKRAKPLLID